MTRKRAKITLRVIAWVNVNDKDEVEEIDEILDILDFEDERFI